MAHPLAVAQSEGLPNLRLLPLQDAVEKACFLVQDHPLLGVGPAAYEDLVQVLQRLGASASPVEIDHTVAGHGHHPGPHASRVGIEGIPALQKTVEDGRDQIFRVLPWPNPHEDIPRHRLVELTVEPPEGALIAPPRQAQQNPLFAVTDASFQVQASRDSRSGVESRGDTTNTPSKVTSTVRISEKPELFALDIQPALLPVEVEDLDREGTHLRQVVPCGQG